MEKRDLQHFDAWAKTFGSTTEGLEQSPTGAYKLTQRFAKFQNIPELSNIWQSAADIRVTEDSPTIVKLRPRLVNDEGEAKRTLQVAAANAEGEALKIKGAAFASFRKTVAEGNAEALQSFAGRTGLSPADGLAFFVSINEMEAVRDAAQAGGRIVFVTGSAKDNQQSALMGMVSDSAGYAPADAPEARTQGSANRAEGQGG